MEWAGGHKRQGRNLIAQSWPYNPLVSGFISRTLILKNHGFLIRFLCKAKASAVPVPSFVFRPVLALPECKRPKGPKPPFSARVPASWKRIKTVFSIQSTALNGSFRKLGVPYFGILIIRNRLFRVLYWGPLFSETPK